MSNVKSKKRYTSSKKTSYKKNTPIRSSTINRTNKKNTNKSKNKPVNKQAYSIIFLGLSILTLALLIIPGNNIWLFFHNLLFGLFSNGAYFLTIVFIYISYTYAKNKSSNNYKFIFSTSICLFILICTLMQILFSSKTSSNENIINFFVGSFNDGINKSGGGLFAAVIAWPLLKLLGFGGTVSLILILIFIITMIISKITLIDLFKAACAPAKKIETIYSEKRINKPKIQNIDIPLDNLPSHPIESNKESFLNYNNSYHHENCYQDQDHDIKTKIKSEISEIPEIDNNISNLDDIIIQNSTNKKLDIDNIDCKTNSPEDINSSNENINSQPDEIDNLINTKIQTNNFEKVQNVDNSQLKSYINNEQKNDIKNSNIEFYQFPSINLLKNFSDNENIYDRDELKTTAQKLVDTLKSFGVSTKLLDFSKGPTVTRYELQPSAGVKISKITGLADDIALNLASAGIRIEAPIPNKAAVGIEIPNKVVSIVSIKEIIDSKEFKNNNSNLTIALGKDISGNIAIADIAKMPHILIAGSTGSGKSVCINSIIISLIYKSSPEHVRLLLIDPKVVELGVYNNIPHLLIPVVTDPKKAAGALNWAVGEMLKRYKIFAEIGVRDLKGYNNITKQRDDLNPLPQIVIIIDELADLMMVAPNEIEDSICRLAQMARAAGMHLVIATQRPSVDVITGIIKANIPSRIAFAVSSQIDSRTIIDSSGAEKLLGRGDMLFFPMGYSKPVRVQGCFVSDKEVEQVVNFIKNSHKSDYDDEISQEIDKYYINEKPKGSSNSSFESQNDDELLPDAIECAIENGSISTSFLQRRLKLGYSRAARLIDEMENQGIVGPKEGSKPRQTLISRQQWIEMNLNKD